MKLTDLTSREAVLDAIHEYDQLGRDEFLTRYGFGEARRYFIEFDGKRYESKAIAGVAVGKQHPQSGYLANNQFSGGIASVGRKMTELGFKFVDELRETGDQASIGDLLAKAMSEFAVERTTPFQKKSKLWAAMDAVKERLESFEAVHNRPHVSCQWSLGAGNWLKIPWIALFDDRVTRSAQSGIYCVLLVAEDLTGAYLTLNQGATEVKDQYGAAGARTVLAERATAYRAKLQNVETSLLTFASDVDLHTNHSNSKLYEVGTIAYTAHNPIQSMTDAQVEEELEQLLSAYDAIRIGHTERVPVIQLTRELGSSDSVPPKPPTNLILYGPPGTGKTYATAEEAVRLCLGDAPLDRAELMKSYQSLHRKGRIGFVTFHQSYSYEEFVEGLRPDTGDGDEASPNSGGFKLTPHDGIFKQIANLAGENRGEAVATETPLVDRSQKIFKMSLGRSWAAEDDAIYQDAIENGYVVLGWGGDVDWSDKRFDDWDAIKERWREDHPEASGNDPNMSQMYAFRINMQVGSIIVISDGNRKFRAIGRVTSPYQFVPSPNGEFNHRRSVEWLWHTEESLPRERIYSKSFSQVSAYQLNSKQVDWDALEQIVSSGGSALTTSGVPEPYVLIIDEINRANISKVFGELITLLEADKRIGSQNELRVKLPYSGDIFGVPSNLHIIGTMNTADRSIALLDTALRRRFTFRELMPDAETLPEYVDGIPLKKVLTTLNERIEYLFDREHQVGHAYFMGCATRAAIDDCMRHKVIPLLAEYFYEDWSKVAAVLGDPTGERFLNRRELMPPSGLDSDGDAQARWRWEVRRPFSVDAYKGFS